MIIRFTKGDGKPDTLTCVRDDGSVTYAPSAVGSKHDLIHYAVETRLRYREAFYGLIAQGRDIDAFGTRDGIADTYTNEAQSAEFIVGLLQWPAVAGPPLSDEDFSAQLAAIYASRQFTPDSTPDISTEDLTAIRDTMRDLFNRWDKIQAGASLELQFPPDQWQPNAYT